MVRWIALKSLLLFGLVCSPVLAQVEIAIAYQQSSTFLSAPRIVAGRILWPEDYQPNIGKVAVVTVASESKNVSVVAVNSKFEFAPLEQSDKPDEYFLATEGEWAVVASYRDEAGKQWTDTEKVTIGKPKPVDPDPIDPPKPDPDGIANIYNVGLISFQNAPRDQSMAAQIAGWYRVEASKLFGQNQTLSNIEKILAAIDAKFAAKQCRDLPTCQQWSVWQAKVKAALVAEQRKRNVFTKQDWWSALIEIAESLERVQ